LEQKNEQSSRIISVNPSYAIPGGEIIINCENFETSNGDENFGCFFDGKAARLVGASATACWRLFPTVSTRRKSRFTSKAAATAANRSASRSAKAG
jgi:hypothetical protein